MNLSRITIGFFVITGTCTFPLWHLETIMVMRRAASASLTACAVSSADTSTTFSHPQAVATAARVVSEQFEQISGLA